MNLIKFRTITCSMNLRNTSTELELLNQMDKIDSQIKKIKAKYKIIKTLRVNIIYTESLSIANLPNLINKLLFLKTILNNYSVRWLSISLCSKQFEDLKNISEIVRTIILKVSNIFVHLIVDLSVNK